MQLLPGTQQLLESDCNFDLQGSWSCPFLVCVIVCAWAELITDMLGSEKYRLSVETMLESLQDSQINKWVNNQSVE